MTCPLAPCDFTADSEDDAVGQAEALIAETRYYAWKHALEAAGGDEDAANRATGYFAQWQAVGRRVRRPVVEMVPRAESIDVVRDGVVVGQLFDYGRETGEESFDVLVGGVVSGQLVRWASETELPAIIADNIVSIDEAGQARRRNRVWRLAGATGPLAIFADRRWTVEGSGWPDMALVDIRAGLKTASPEPIGDRVAGSPGDSARGGSGSRGD
jgi:hypothetical protein